jgi:hypothetical protein
MPDHAVPSLYLPASSNDMPGFVVLAIPEPVLGQSGRRKGSRLEAPAVHFRFYKGPATLMAHRIRAVLRRSKIVRTAEGGHQQTRSNAVVCCVTPMVSPTMPARVIRWTSDPRCPV